MPKTFYSTEGAESREQAECDSHEHRTTRVTSIVRAFVCVGKSVGVCVVHTRTQRSQTSHMGRGMIGILGQ